MALERRPRLRMRRHRAAAALLAGMLAGTVAAVVAPTPSVADETQVVNVTVPKEVHCVQAPENANFPCIADLALDWDGSGAADGITYTRAMIDHGLRQLIVTGAGFNIHQLDLDAPGLPRQVARTRFIDPQVNQLAAVATAALDERHHRLFVGASVCSDFEDCSTGVHQIPMAAISLIGEFDQIAFRFPDEFADHEPEAMAYDAVHDVVYVAAWEGGKASTALASTRGTAGLGTRMFIHAFDAEKIVVGEPSHLWAYSLTSCPALAGAQPVFGVGATGDYLYFPCKGTEGFVEGFAGFDVGWVRGRAPGVVVLDLAAGRDAWTPRSEADAPSEFVPDYFPFAGNMFWGEVGIDLAGERVIAMPGNAGTKRIFVFDARHRAWTGSRPAGNGDPGGVGVDARTGRTYMTAKADTALYILDAAQLPVPAGKTIPGVGVARGTKMAVDPVTRRVYKPESLITDDETGEVKPAGIRVYEDRTPPPGEPSEPADPDDETNDIDEDEAVAVTHSGAASAYGARTLLAGGTANTPPGDAVEWVRSSTVTDQIWGPLSQIPVITESIQNALRLEPATRDSFAALVGGSEPPLEGARLSGDRDSSTASARAVGMSLGEANEDELASIDPCASLPGCSDGRGDLADGMNGGEDEGPGDNLTKGADEVLTSQVEPLRPATCVSGLGNDGSDESPDAFGSARVACQPLKLAAGQAAAGNPLSEGDISVRHAGARATVRLDPVYGTVTQAVASAEGIEIHTPEGSLAIGMVRTTATSRANGRPRAGEEPGAASTFDTVMSHVTITHAGGADGYSCTTDCDPGEVKRQINRWFPATIQAHLPRRDMRPEVLGSDGGAQAMNTKDEYAFYSDQNFNGDLRREIVGLTLFVANDGNQPSRTILQLGGVRTESHYEIGDKFRPFTSPPRGPAPVVTSGGDDAAGVQMVLTDTSGAPLAGGVFSLNADTDGNGALGPGDESLAACSTGDDGTCGFDNVTLGSYVVREEQPPDGYQPSEDVAFALTQPGQVATIGIVNARVTEVAPAAATRPVVTNGTTTPPDASPFRKLLRIPGDLAQFLIRNPAQALLFALLWGLGFTPLYLAARRRDLLVTKEYA